MVKFIDAELGLSDSDDPNDSDDSNVEWFYYDLIDISLFPELNLNVSDDFNSK